MKVLTAEEMRALEKRADASDISYHQMMESAGLAVAEAIRDQRDPKKFPRVAVLVGPGNNGGDGLVAARHLAHWGYQVAVYLAKARPSDDDNLKLAVEAGAHVVTAEKDSALNVFRRIVAECDVFVDALLGTGVSRPIEGRFRDILLLAREQMASRRAAAENLSDASTGKVWIKEPPPKPEAAPILWVVAVDLPSGLNADTGALDGAALPADLTVTIAFPKRGHFLFPGAGAVGRLLVADIGIPHEWAEASLISIMTPRQVGVTLPARPLDAHKGTFGRAFIVAGSVNYTGAAGLAAAAAVRAGAGLVTLCVGASVRAAVASQLPETTYLMLPEELGVLREEGARLVLDALPEGQALLLGPGLGQEQTTRRLVWALLGLEADRRRQHIGFIAPDAEEKRPVEPRPVVVDADGLNALAALDDWRAEMPTACILTPHPGEMARLLKCTTGEVQSSRIETALHAASAWRQIVVLKGAHTIVASPEGRATICPFANPALATAGTGDVLSGILVGLLAQGMSAYDAAVAGVYVHALAGEMASQRTGPSGLAASDLLAWIPVVMARLRGEKPLRGKESRGD